MKTLRDITALVSMCSFPGLHFHVVPGAEEGRPYLQITCPDGTDNITGEPMVWKSRKWPLSFHMTDGEVVQTAFKAVLTAYEHELREKFTFMGQMVFGPHFDIYALVELAASPRGHVGRE